MGRIAFLDMVSGVSGDMFLSSLVDAGVSPSKIQNLVNEKLAIGAEVSFENVEREGITAMKMNLSSNVSEKERSLDEILTILDESEISSEVRDRSKEVFKLLGKAEAEVHGEDFDDVHFHEIGKLDSIIEIVGTVFCLKELKIDQLFYSSFKVGTDGTTNHGSYPVPAPATLELLEGEHVKKLDVGSELSTPTGVALARVLGKQETPPSFNLENIGYGAGKKELEIPNLVRIEIGSLDETNNMENLWLIETNIDDMNPEFFENVEEKLLENGALDVWINNINMKKSRPGFLLSVLSPLDRDVFQNLKKIIFEETSTIGFRRQQIERISLPREIKTVNTEFGEVKVKIAYKDSEIVNIAPEYEDCKRLSKETGVSLKKIHETALSQARQELT